MNRRICRRSHCVALFTVLAACSRRCRVHKPPPRQGPGPSPASHPRAARVHRRQRLVRRQCVDQGSLLGRCGRRRGRQLLHRAGQTAIREIALAARQREDAAASKGISFEITPSRSVAGGRGLRARRFAGWRTRHGAYARGTFLRRGDPVAAAHGVSAAERRGADPRHADQRRAAFRLARTHARFGAALPVARVHPQFHRLDGAAQAQRAALASHRRPGLASRDQEVSEAHLGGRLARAGRGRRRAKTSIRRPASRACTAASTRRSRRATSWPTPPRATSR